MTIYPDDNDGLALQKLHNAGCDMTAIIHIEFFILVENKLKANFVLDLIKHDSDLIYESIEVIHDPGELEEGEPMTQDNHEFWPSYSVCISRRMVPNYESIVNYQKLLKKCVSGNGDLDGWGVRLVS